MVEEDVEDERERTPGVDGREEEKEEEGPYCTCEKRLACPLLVLPLAPPTKPNRFCELRILSCNTSS